MSQEARRVAQKSGWAQGQDNARQALALTAMADEGLRAIVDTVAQMRSLAVLAAHGPALTMNVRQVRDTQYAALADQVQAIAQATRYNDTSLTDGTKPSLQFQVGVDAGFAHRILAPLPDATISSLGLDHTHLHNQQDAQNAIGVLDGALAQMSVERQRLYATSLSLQSAQRFAEAQGQNLQDAQRRNSAAAPSQPASSAHVQALVRSRSARRAQLIYQALLPQ